MRELATKGGPEREAAVVKRIQLRLVDIAIVSKRNNPVRQGLLGKGFRTSSVSGGHSLTPFCGVEMGGGMKSRIIFLKGRTAKRNPAENQGFQLFMV